MEGLTPGYGKRECQRAGAQWLVERGAPSTRLDTMKTVGLTSRSLVPRGHSAAPIDNRMPN